MLTCACIKVQRWVYTNEQCPLENWRNSEEISTVAFAAFLVSFNATVAGNGCDDKEEVDSENKRITVPKTTCGVL